MPEGVKSAAKRALWWSITPKRVSTGIAGVGCMLSLYAIDFFVYRRYANPLIKPSLVRAIVEVDREPCRTLEGFDVVVKRMEYSGSLGAVTAPFSWPFAWWLLCSETPQAITHHWSEALMEKSNRSLLARTYRWLFYDELKPYVSQEDMNEPANQPRRIGLPQKLADSEAGVTPRQAVSGKASKSLAFMVLEPTGQEKRRNSVLQSLLDGATEQSLVQCRASAGGSSCDNEGQTLLAPYLRTMLSCIAWTPIDHSLRVAQLGVAGGSLPMFVQRYISHRITSFDLVEIEPACFDVAQRSMGFRDTKDIFKLHTADGSIFIATSEAASYDILLVDMFVGAQLPNFMTDSVFIDDCRRALTISGVAAFNLPRKDEEFVTICKSVFGEKNVFVAPCYGSTNTIVFGLKNATGIDLDFHHLVQRAATFSSSNRLPYDLSAQLPFLWRLR